MNKVIILLIVCLALTTAYLPPPCPTRGLYVYYCAATNLCVSAEECQSISLKREEGKY